MTRRTRILRTPIALAAVGVLLAACSESEADDAGIDRRMNQTLQSIDFQPLP